MKLLSELVTIITQIPESRLLPENPANGDIPCFDATATVGGGNDANTKALIHFDTEVKDEAAGNAAPLALSSLNATIDTTVSKFGSGSLKLTSGHVFVPISDLTAVNCVISCWVYLDSLPRSYSPLFCQDDDTVGSWNLAVDNSGIYMFCRGGASKAQQPLQAKTWYWAAIVKSGKELRFYLNGAYIYSLTDSILRFTNPIIGIGEQINEDGRKFTGNVDEFRIQFLTADELSAWTGLTIPVPVEAYSVAQTVGKWGKLNKNELVQSVNGITPDENGNVNIDSALTLDQLEYNDVPYKYQGMTIDSSSEDSNMTSRFYGKAVSTFGDLDSTATFPSFPFKPYLRDDSLVGGEAAIYYELWKSDSTNTDEWNTIEFKSVNAPSKIIKISAQTAGTDACVMSYTLDGLRKDGAILARIVQGKMTLPASSASNVLGDFSELNFNTNEIAEQYFDSFELKVRTEGASGDKAASGIASIKFMITEKNAAWVGINKKNLVRSINGYKPLDGAVTLPEATASAAGLMAAADKVKLDSLNITESRALPGYFKLPGGTIVQWGNFVVTADPQAQEITLPVALSSIYSKQVSGSNSSLKIGIYGGTNGKITCYVEGSTSGTVDWMVIGK